MTKKTWMTLLLLALATVFLRFADATTRYMSSFNSAYPNSRLTNNCMVCHANNPPDEDNLNRYGKDFDNNHKSFGAIESLDSDGDGYSNAAEINTGTLPGDSTSSPSSPPPPTPPPSPDGAALYAGNCANCHNPLASSTKKGRSATQIQNAINNNTGGMGSLSGLTSAQVAAIAAALATAAPVLTTVNVTPATASTIPGATQQLTASPLDQNGAAFAGATTAWSSSNSPVATVNTKGLVTGVSAGTATITATATSGAVTKTATSLITVTAVATPPPSPSPSTADLTLWSGQWMKVTMKYQGYLFGKPNPDVSNDNPEQDGTENVPKITMDHENMAGYLKFVSWDPNQAVLLAEIHQKNPESGQWVSDPLALHLIGGSSTDFLCWIQVNGDSTSGFVVRIQGKEKNGVLKNGTFKTLGGYYFEMSGGTASSSPGSLAGSISINGSLVPEAKVPVQK
jgi:uncharacterized protein YjdB